jgi:hypothetical protein
MLHSGLKGIAIPALALVLVALAAGAATEPFGQVPKEPIKWSIQAKVPEKPLKPGDNFLVQLTATIDEGWHLYSPDQEEGGPTPTRIVMPAEQPFEQAGAIESAEPKSAMDSNFNLMTRYYEEQAVFIIPVKVSDRAAAGKSEVKVNVSFQTCNDELCLPPKTMKLSAAVSLTR